MQLSAKFKQILYMGFRATLTFRKFNGVVSKLDAYFKVKFFEILGKKWGWRWSTSLRKITKKWSTLPLRVVG